MRPLRLTMQAFGPYAERQSIDFAAALEAGLFGIYGPTGSGKSSIFSALTFALFGEATKGEQDAASMRSDHAAAQCITEVELIFELGGKRYLVRRRPEQMRPAQRGGGETREAHAAWLFDVSDVPLREIGPENCGKILAEKKVKDVEEALLRLLGYGAEQFRQIVLLPQGKFETFLTAKTTERQKILRELFDVSLYEKLAQKLRDDAKAADEKIRTERTLCADRLLQAGFTDHDALVAGIAVAGETLEAAQAARSVADAAGQIAEEAWALAQREEQAFVEKAKADEDLTRISMQAEEIATKERLLAAARMALSMADLDHALAAARSSAQRSQEHRQACTAAHLSAQAHAMTTAQALACEQAKAPQLELQRTERDALRRHLQTLTDAADFATNADATARIAQVRDAELTSAQATHVRLRTGFESESTRLTTARMAASERARLTGEMDILRQIVKAAKASEEAQNTLATAKTRQTKTADQLSKAQNAFTDAETALSGAQALHLAEKLMQGAPCPVCGSRDHPAPAHGSTESAGLDTKFRQAKAALDEAMQADAAAQRAHAAADATWRERSTALDALNPPAMSIAELTRTGIALSQQRDTLGPEIDIPQLEAELGSLADQITQAAGRVEEARTAHETARTTAALARQTLESALSSVPPHLQARPALDAALERIDRAITRAETALDTALRAERAGSDALILARSALDNAAANHEQALVHVASAQAALDARLASHSLTLEAYQQHKADIPRITALQEQITAHAGALAAAKARVERAHHAVHDRVRPDLAAQMAAKDHARQQRDEATRTLTSATDMLARLHGLQDGIREAQSRIEAAEAAFSPLKNLADACNSQNQKKIRLEVFAIMAMFDRVLEAANLRLQPMSSGRYSLVREEDGGKAGGRVERGLVLNVHDVHTGKQRPTYTLSGGESFMAALALALGLSDVVESVSGGIHLDTIFIDEGFGSLDTQTLDQALQTLQDLVGQSRAVGLISHVELVQQAIPNGFQIRKTATGSHIEVRHSGL